MAEEYDKIKSWMLENGVGYRVISHGAVHRVGDEGQELGGPAVTKCLLLTDSKAGRVFMVAMRGEERLDLKKLAASLGVGRLQFVHFEDVKKLAGIEPGTVSVFNVVLPEFQKGIELIFDKNLLSKVEIGFHPNRNTATLLTSPKDVFRFCREYFKFVSALSV